MNIEPLIALYSNRVVRLRRGYGRAASRIKMGHRLSRATLFVTAGLRLEQAERQLSALRDGLTEDQVLRMFRTLQPLQRG